MKPALKWLLEYRLALIGLWLAAIWVVDPRGNFSLDDDWVYAAAVKHLLLTGHFRLPWSSVTLLTEALWGAGFCKLFGFSFTTLRISTLVASACGILAFYETLLVLRTKKPLAFLGALCLMFTPYFFNLSFTFMTDGFSCSCVIATLLFLLRNMENGSRRDLVLGMGFALVATLTRQIGLCVPVAWGIARILENPKRLNAWLSAWTPAVVIGGAFLIYTATLRVLGEMPSKYNPQGAVAIYALHHPGVLLNASMSAAPEILIYSGLFLAPTAPLLWLKAHQNAALRPRGVLVICLLWIGGIIPVLLRHQERIPFRGSTLENFRLGNYYDSSLPTLPISVWYAVTLVGIFGACSVILAFAIGISRINDSVLPSLDKRRFRFLLISIIVYFAPVLLVSDYLDRYILPAIPIALLALFLIMNQGGPEGMPVPKLTIAASFTILAGIALFSVIGTRDYLSYYRASWIARRFVVSQGVPSNLVFNVPDWGPAYFDGDFLNDDELYMNGPVPHADSGYEVGTEVKPGYEIIKLYPVYMSLNQQMIRIFVSKRP